MKDIIKQHNDKKDEETIRSFIVNFKNGEDVAVSLIQRRCRVGYNSAYRCFDKLSKEGFIKKSDSSIVSKVVNLPNK